MPAMQQPEGLPRLQAIAHGMRPVLLEMPGHERSAGGTSNLPQFARAIAYAAGQLQQEGHAIRVLAAHSLGPVRRRSP